MPHTPEPGSAGQFCTRIVSVVWPTLSVEEAARVMRDRGVGWLAVVEGIEAGARRVVGVLTDRDIAIRIVASQRAAHGLEVGDLMSRDVATVREDDDLMDVLDTMRRRGVRRVPVVAASGHLVGVLSVDDLLSVIAEQLRLLSQAIAWPRDAAAGAGGTSPGPGLGIGP